MSSDYSVPQMEERAWKPSVCVVTVTYGDRRGYLSQTLKSIESQTYKVDSVIIVDNGSCYPLDEILAQFPITYHLIRFESNEGSAVGFSAGIQAALHTQADLIWLLDDDNKPQPTSLSEAVKLHLESQDTVLCTRTTPGFGLRLSCKTSVNGFLGFNVADTLNGMGKIWSSVFRHGRQKDDYTSRCSNVSELIDIAPYGGLLIRAELIKRIGLPREDFVTYADDTEWTSRIVKNGGRIQRCRDAFLVDLDPSWNQRVGRVNPIVSPNVGLYRIYYGVRNQTYLDFRSASNKWLFYLNVGIRASVIVFNLILFSSDTYASLKRFGVFLKAVTDGIRGRLGYRLEYENSR